MSDDAPAAAVDPDGRAVELTEERWAHITGGHPELTRVRDAVLATVRAPDRRAAGPTLGEAWFYKENVGPSRWPGTVGVVIGWPLADVRCASGGHRDALSSIEEPPSGARW